MLSHSSSISSKENPILLDESERDIKTMMIIIAGHPCEALDRCKSWNTAKRLYRLMQKYQLDRLQPWFSMMACEWAGTAPFEALCMACNNPCFDENLARCAILYGIEDSSTEKLFDPVYFISNQADKDVSERKAYLLNPTNVKTKLHMDLGFKGSVAYCSAFSELWVADDESVDWQGTAQCFINAARAFDKHKGTSVRQICSPPCPLSLNIVRLASPHTM
jgi:hypothetical protein